MQDCAPTYRRLAPPINRFLTPEPCRSETGDGAVVVTRDGAIYKLQSILGVGGLSVVYLAVRYSDGVSVALKLPNRSCPVPDLAAKLLSREAAILSRLDHVNIIKVVDVGETAAGEPYLAMDLVRAQTVDVLMVANAGRLPVTRAVNVCLQVSEALAYAHKHNVVHRDIKPANIMVRTSGNHDRIMLFDFGIASLEGDQTDIADTGSLLYTSPEQLCSRESGNAGDVYQLALVLYETIVGSLPFERDVVSAVRYRQGEMPLIPDSVDETLLPKHLRELLLDSLEPDAKARISSMEMFGHRLRNALTTDRMSSLRFAANAAKVPA